MALPDRCCDLVMKGGVTSGVVYPHAISEIASRFHLVGIGGTSAGAIAAVMAAAAEYRRRTQRTDDGFRRLVALADELAQPGRLLSLFTPDRSTRKLFRTVIELACGRAGPLTKLNFGRRLLFNREALLAPVRDNLFGLCTGMANGNRGSGCDPLGEWLVRTVDEVAGKQGAPLTFRDLHGAPQPDCLHRMVGDGLERSIDLRAVTTCLTFGRPLELPFDTEIFAFDPVEWRRLFPSSLVDYLGEVMKDVDAPHRRRDGKLPLPTLDLPVAVAARMSLSFPLLISMVPLWAIDFQKDGEPLERVWFSDGGITSNFPLHRFDALYPQWPTLGITLANTGASRQPAHPAMRRTGSLLYMPASRGDGVLDPRVAIDGGPNATADLLAFAKAIFGSAQNWHDNSYLRLPGYRDRLVEIWMYPEEGGLNLEMAPETIAGLVTRGRQAGEDISRRFAETPPGEAMSWDGHRWTRFRSAMAGLMDTLGDLRTHVKAPPMAADKPLLDFLADGADLPCYAYKTKSQRRSDEKALLSLLATLDGMAALDPAPFAEAPRPPVEIGSRAPM